MGLSSPPQSWGVTNLILSKAIALKEVAMTDNEIDWGKGFMASVNRQWIPVCIVLVSIGVAIGWALARLF